MTDTMYNGWTNKPTWLVKLWIDNDQDEQEFWLERAALVFNAPYALAQELEETYEDAQSELVGVTGFWSDLMSWAIASVDWTSIARAFIEEAMECWPSENYQGPI